VALLAFFLRHHIYNTHPIITNAANEKRIIEIITPDLK
jgi:hypothetical protein